VWQPCELLYTCYLLTYLPPRTSARSMFATAIRRRPSTVEYGTLFHCRHNATNRRVKVGHEMKLNSTFPEYWTTLKTAGCYSGEQYHQCSQLMRRHIGRHRHSNIGNHWHPYTSFQWRSQDLEVGAQGVWETEVPSGVQGQSPWWVVRGEHSLPKAHSSY